MECLTVFFFLYSFGNKFDRRPLVQGAYAESLVVGKLAGKRFERQHAIDPKD